MPGTSLDRSDKDPELEPFCSRIGLVGKYDFFRDFAHLANFTPSLAMYTPARRSSYSTFDKIPASGTSGKTQRRRTSRLYGAKMIVSRFQVQHDGMTLT